MAFSGLANESARLTYTTPRWIFQRRTPRLGAATKEVTLAGVAVVSSLRALIIQTYRVPSISVLHRERMWAAWRCRRLGIPRHALFTVSYWNCTRGTHRCFARARGNGNAFYLSPRRQPVKAAPRDRRPCFHLQIYLTFLTGRYRKASARENEHGIWLVQRLRRI